MPEKHPVRLHKTADGSDTYFSERFGNCFHSRHGAIQESRHVFIKEGLARVKAENKPIRVLEYGFGTGLNAILSLSYARDKNTFIDYTTLEKYPISIDQARALNYPGLLDDCLKDDFLKMHNALWNEWFQLDTYFRLFKQNIDFLDFQADECFELIFFDAFAPENHPEAWEIPNLENAYNALVTGGHLSTYCAKGVFKRRLKEIGFKVHAVAGPPGKREMTLAWKS